MDIDRTSRGAARLFTALALAGFAICLAHPWEPKADFDLAGIGWFLANLPGIFAAGSSALAAIAAAHFWSKVAGGGH